MKISTSTVLNILFGGVLGSMLLVGLTTSAADYDPWLDSNDDGKIRVDDILAAALNFGAG